MSFDSLTNDSYKPVLFRLLCAGSIKWIKTFSATRVIWFTDQWFLWAGSFKWIKSIVQLVSFDSQTIWANSFQQNQKTQCRQCLCSQINDSYEPALLVNQKTCTSVIWFKLIYSLEQVLLNSWKTYQCSLINKSSY